MDIAISDFLPQNGAQIFRIISFGLSRANQARGVTREGEGSKGVFSEKVSFHKIINLFKNALLHENCSRALKYSDASEGRKRMDPMGGWGCRGAFEYYYF
jgi:hypothetical protein